MRAHVRTEGATLLRVGATLLCIGAMLAARRRNVATRGWSRCDTVDPWRFADPYIPFATLRVS
jgi:hypothetical protein